MGTDDTYGLLRSLTSPITAITSAHRDRRNGLIANSAIRASLDPDRPRLAIFVLKRNYTHGMIFESGAFALHLLHTGQLPLVRKLGFVSGRDTDKFSDIECHVGETGAPLLDDAYARFDCRVVNAMDVGPSTCFLGEAVRVERGVGDDILTSDHWRAHMPDDWREPYLANLRAAQEWAADRSEIQPLIWRDLKD